MLEITGSEIADIEGGREVSATTVLSGAAAYNTAERGEGLGGEGSAIATGLRDCVSDSGGARTFVACLGTVSSSLRGGETGWERLSDLSLNTESYRVSSTIADCAKGFEPFFFLRDKWVRGGGGYGTSNWPQLSMPK